MTDQRPLEIGEEDVVPPPIAVPVASEDEEPDLDLPSNLPVLPSRDAVLYPGMLLPLQATDQRWVGLLSDAVSGAPAHRDHPAARSGRRSLEPVGPLSSRYRGQHRQAAEAH